MIVLSIVGMGSLSRCLTNHVPLPMPVLVDLDRFMGRWYVIGYTPIVVDKQAHNAIEHYRLDSDAKIQTTYQFRDGGFDGEIKTYTPVGWVHNQANNAEWRMQFIWPLRADYVILHVDEDYTETIIAHPNRKYAWIMTRSPEVGRSGYERMVKQLEAVGYDRSVIQRMPHDWSGEAEREQELESAGL